MLPVTSWPPVRPGFWSSPFGAPTKVHPGHHRDGFPLPKGCWLVITGSNQVEFLIRPVDPEEPYWKQPGTGVVHGMPRPPHRPTWPDEDWPREGWPWARVRGGEADMPWHPDHPHKPWPWEVGTKAFAYSPKCPSPPLPPHPPHPPHPPGPVRRERLVAPHTTGIVFSDGQNVRIFGTGEATCIKVFSA